MAASTRARSCAASSWLLLDERRPRCTQIPAGHGRCAVSYGCASHPSGSLCCVDRGTRRTSRSMSIEPSPRAAEPSRLAWSTGRFQALIAVPRRSSIRARSVPRAMIASAARCSRLSWQIRVPRWRSVTTSPRSEACRTTVDTRAMAPPQRAGRFSRTDSPVVVPAGTRSTADPTGVSRPRRLNVAASRSPPKSRPYTTQADALRPLLDNARRLRELISELEGLALKQVKDDPTQPDP